MSTVLPLGIALLALGITAGWFAARVRTGSLRRRLQDMEHALKEEREQQAAYRDRVSRHFERTSDLVRDLTLQYRAVYDHLSDGARELCPDRLLPLARAAEADRVLPETSGAANAQLKTESERWESDFAAADQIEADRTETEDAAAVAASDEYGSLDVAEAPDIAESPDTKRAAPHSEPTIG